MIKAGDYIIPWENKTSSATIETTIHIDEELPMSEFMDILTEFMTKTFNSRSKVGMFDKFKTDLLQKNLEQSDVLVIPMSDGVRISACARNGYDITECNENWCIMRKDTKNETIIKE